MLLIREKKGVTWHDNFGGGNESMQGDRRGSAARRCFRAVSISPSDVSGFEIVVGVGVGEGIFGIGMSGCLILTMVSLGIFRARKGIWEEEEVVGGLVVGC